jgi:hypothetical protein
MARRATARDSTKEQSWRHLLQQWQRSDLSVRAFCGERGIAEPSFYAWRRIIAQRDARTEDGVPRPSAPPADDTPRFLPLQIVPTTAGAPLELVLASGRIVRVPAGFDATALRQLLALLEEQPPC